MQFSYFYWQLLLGNNLYFDGRGLCQRLHQAFWRQNLRLFGSINILLILGVDHLASNYENAGKALNNPSILNQVQAALVERQSLAETILAQLDQITLQRADELRAPNWQVESVVLARLQIFHQWRDLLQRPEELNEYIAAMDTTGVGGLPIWDYTLSGVHTTRVVLSHRTVQSDHQIREILCDICRQHKKNHGFAHLPCCGRVGGSQTIHQSCLLEWANKSEQNVGRGNVMCPFCRGIIQLESVGRKGLDISEQEAEQASVKGFHCDNGADQKVITQRQIDWDPPIPCTSSQAAQHSRLRKTFVLQPHIYNAPNESVNSPSSSNTGVFSSVRTSSTPPNLSRGSTPPIPQTTETSDSSAVSRDLPDFLPDALRASNSAVTSVTQPASAPIQEQNFHPSTSSNEGGHNERGPLLLQMFLRRRRRGTLVVGRLHDHTNTVPQEETVEFSYEQDLDIHQSHE